MALFLCFAFMAQAQLVTNNGDTIYISNNSGIYVGGSFNNIDNGTHKPYMHNDGKLWVDSNWSTAGDMIYTGQDSFIAFGTGNQNIQGTNFWNFIINNGGTKTLTSNAKINNKLFITNGILKTGSDTATLDSMAVLTEDSADYVMGNLAMTKYLSKSKKDTFGNMGVEITPVGTSPGMTKTVRVTGPGSAQMGNGNHGIDRYFQITPAHDKSLNAKVVFHYFQGELDGDAESDLSLFRSEDEGLTWYFIGYTSRDINKNTLTTVGIDSFSRFTLGSSITPLPVKLLNFSAVLVNKKDGYLTWETASEINNSHFEIDRSIDGSTWMKAGEVQGNGTTADIHYYNFTDPDINLLAVPIVYYRLKQVDYNGGFTYSAVREVNLDEAAANSLKVWYNQTEDRIYINYSTTNNSENLHLVLTDMQGKIIVSQNIQATTGINQMSVNMYGLAKAIYNLTTVTNETTNTARILKN